MIKYNSMGFYVEGENTMGRLPEIPTHPVQKKIQGRGFVPQVVTLRAYEVYKHVFGSQEALITGECRGGFGVSELIAFLYAYPFPKEEWGKRVEEALAGMENV